MGVIIKYLILGSTAWHTGSCLEVKDRFVSRAGIALVGVDVGERYFSRTSSDVKLTDYFEQR